MLAIKGYQLSDVNVTTEQSRRSVDDLGYMFLYTVIINYINYNVL